MTRARPLYPGHVQPKLPADLGYYDLRVPEVRAQQAALASRYGIEAFCYWHYWFGDGVQLLERPFREVLESGEPRFPFCLGWANHHWTKRWGPGPERMLMEQRYPGSHDHVRHFRHLERALHDPRYVRVDGRPLVVLFDPIAMPEVSTFLDCWNTLAVQSGLKGLYFVAHLNEPGTASEPFVRQGFDAALANLSFAFHSFRNPAWVRACKQLHLRVPNIVPYARFIRHPMFLARLPVHRHALIVPNWDDTPRRGERGLVLHGSNPERFRLHVRTVLETTVDQPADRRLVFIRSWNEWAEGNYLEPDRRFGHRYLQALLDEAGHHPAPDPGPGLPSPRPSGTTRRGSFA